MAILLRILSFSSKKLWYICWILMATNVIWGLGSVTGLVLQCNATKMLTVDDATFCPDQASFHNSQDGEGHDGEPAPANISFSNSSSAGR